MKSFIRSTGAALVITVTCLAHGAAPPLSVTVSDAGGKAAFRGSTDAEGTFSTTKLLPGKYVVQLNAKSSGMNGKQYSVVVAAGKTKVGASAVAGEKFSGGGVALRLDNAAGLNITGQVSAYTGPTSKSGKKMVWISKQLGSNMPGRWVEEGSAEAIQAKTARNMSFQDVQNRQNHGDQ